MQWTKKLLINLRVESEKKGGEKIQKGFKCTTYPG
jgi:hypothetical protein